LIIYHEWHAVNEQQPWHGGSRMSEGEGAAPKLVLYEVEAHVAVITFNRPQRLNAWTPQMGAAYADVLDEAAADPEVRAIVVTGAGRAFSVGADLDLLATVGGGAAIIGDSPRLYPTHAIDIPKPVIAAINGPCAGGGFVLALACDVRFAASGAKLTSAFARRGLIAEYGSAWLLTRLVGVSAALDLLLSGRTFEAEEALSLGLVNFTAPQGELLNRAIEYARELARDCAPNSMSAIKRQVWSGLDATYERALAESVDLMSASLDGHDLGEGVASFRERRHPNFDALRSDHVARPAGGT
jgi:enoyl-CoA hydratase/carnithine racemase